MSFPDVSVFLIPDLVINQELSLLREARGGGSSFEFNTNPSQRTKAAAEEAFLRENPQSTIIRPSIIFGLGDSFFTVSRGKVSHPSR